MLSRKFLVTAISLLMITSLLLGAAVQSTEAQGSAPVTHAQAPAPGETPHYYGPYPNWANSPQALANAVVTIAPAPSVPVSIGHPLGDRSNATDYATAPGILGPVFVVIPGALPAGTLENFQTWNQTTIVGSPTASAGGLFHAYLLRPTAVTNEYTVVYDSGEQTVPVSTNPAGEILTIPAPSVPVQAGDVIGFYGEGIPADAGGGTDIFSYLATTDPDLTTPAAPVLNGTISLGTDPGFPIFSQDRTYSFAATVTPTVPLPGMVAEATATVNPKTGGISAITVTNPGNGYVTAPIVSITAPGMTPTTQASATAVISSGVLTSIAVVESGFGFTAPEVTITGGSPTAGFNATAVASGGVDDFVLTSGGSGYTIQPLVEFSLPNLPSGIPATGSATMDANGVVDGVAIVDPGSGYTSAPTVTIFDGSTKLVLADPALATATVGINQIDLTSGGQGYDSAPTVNIIDLGGTSVVPASAVATIAVRGAVTAINITNPGAGYITPGLKKFVDTLPGLGSGAANNLGQYIPVAIPDTTTYPGSDYYEVAVVQYRMKFHSSLPPTLLRGYVQLSTDVVPGSHVALSNENFTPGAAASPIFLPDGSPAYGVDTPHYLGPTIVATKDRPVRILFRNLLPTGQDGDLFLPMDSTLMGAGPGPDMMTLDANGVPEEMHPDEGTVYDRIRNPMCNEVPKPAGCFSENRATLHMHGGITPWISDGTPHQWTTPDGENTAYPQGVSVSNVPDMPDPGPGALTFFYTNQQSARLLFYHDHAWGITCLNVYAGEAAGYLITDDIEKALIAPAGALAGLGLGTPLIIQDKTFVPSPAKMAEQDPTWQYNRWGGEGSLWAPHVYMPAQNPSDPTGMSSFGRWMYGPFFWPPANAKYPPIANPYYDPTCDPDVQPFCEPALIPGTPNVSVGMEAFNDTPLVNGAAYPTTTVEPKAYRYRILNAANDRFWNLSWYVADPRTGTLSEVALNPAELAAAQTDPVVFPTPDLTYSPKGPNWIQIGTEGGFLPAPVVIPAQPTTWITDPTRFDVGNVDQHSLLLAPAERADVIVDFSQFRGKTLILYNDAPAAFPARVPGYDYYTGGPDLSPSGAPTTLPGYGPNTRTIMQVKVSNGTPAVAFDRPGTTADRLGALLTAFAHKADGSGVFEKGQNPIIVGQAAYNSAYGSNFAASGWCNSPTNPAARCDGYARISEQGGNLFGFNTLAAPNAKMQIPLQPKGIHDEMNSANFDEFGRMTANIGLEAPGATPLTQNIILYPYVNPVTEVLDATGMPSSLDVTPISSAADGTQIWKITHNGVDTHPIHFHLYDIQLINRVAWDNIISPPDPNELGWKDTVRVNPLQDTYVAIRPIVPAVPFGVPDSIRPLNPMMPIGARGARNGINGQEAGFNNTGPTGAPIAPIINEVINFYWEYVWHCHILSHEEMDMMRPVSVFVPRALPDAPVLTFTRGSVILNWTDGTPVNYADPTTWGNPKNEIGFRIERAAIGNNGVIGAYSVVTTVPANTTTYTDLTPIPGQGFSYRVIAFNAADGASTSNEIVVAAPPPADPTGLVANAVSATQASLAWTDNATTENGYDIMRAPVTNGQAGTFVRIDGVGLNVTTYTDPTAVANTTYAYQVVAFNLGGYSNPSNIATVTTPDVPPTAPSGLSAVLQNGPQVGLAWTETANNETSFVVERSDNGGAFAALATLPANSVNYTDTAVAAGNAYTYRVMAANAGGPSAYSNTASVTLNAPPATPTALTYTLLTNPTRVRLAWLDNATTETGFEVERSVNGGAYTLLTTVAARNGSGPVTYTNTGVTSGNIYSYRVRAINAAGSSAYTNVVSVTIGSIPVAPTNLTDALLANPLRVRLTWRDNANNEANFVLERAANGGAFTVLATVAARNGTGNTVTYNDTTVLAGNTYDYRVMAVNGVGPSAYSNIFTASILPPAAPSNFTATAVANGTNASVTLTWADNSNNETRFEIQHATNAAFTAGLNTSTVAANITLRVESRNRNRTIYYRIRAVNPAGVSAWVNMTPFPIVTP